MDNPTPVNVAIPREVHDSLSEVSRRTGLKIRVLVERAIRKAYPVKNGKRRAEERVK